MKPTYLGDGVYAQVEDGYIVLTTESHLKTEADNCVYLEPQVLTALIAYIQKARELA